MATKPTDPTTAIIDSHQPADGMRNITNGITAVWPSANRSSGVVGDHENDATATRQSPAALVAEFHDAFDLPRATTPTLLSVEERDHRHWLLEEEVHEAWQAMADGDLSGIAQELTDVVYVAYGTALAYGIDLDAVLAEVHRANMAKLGAGGPVVRNGKVVKPEGWQKPDVAGVLARSAERGAA